jgi:hypothetical protein
MRPDERGPFVEPIGKKAKPTARGAAACFVGHEPMFEATPVDRTKLERVSNGPAGEI